MKNITPSKVKLNTSGEHSKNKKNIKKLVKKLRFCYLSSFQKRVVSADLETVYYLPAEGLLEAGSIGSSYAAGFWICAWRLAQVQVDEPTIIVFLCSPI